MGLCSQCKREVSVLAYRDPALCHACRRRQLRGSKRVGPVQEKKPNVGDLHCFTCNRDVNRLARTKPAPECSMCWERRKRGGLKEKPPTLTVDEAWTRFINKILSID